jgi:DNA-binding LytR/AlgR family response regulator
MTLKKQILIVEDEFVIAADIESAVIKLGYNSLGIARCADDFFNFIKANDKPDLVLLDITLGESQKGIAIAEFINKELQIPFIYITSHTDTTTIQKVAYTKPCGYLVKPFDRQRLAVAIELALSEHALLKEEHVESDFIEIQGKEGKEKINLAEVLFFEANLNYTVIRTISKKLIIRRLLKDIMVEPSVEKKFVRIHKSYAVNKAKIESKSARNVMVLGHKLPVGRSFAQDIPF